MPLVAEPIWLAALQGTPCWHPPDKPTIVIAPHPDDETLGVGGLIAEQRRRGLSVLVIAVTDGEAAYQETYGLGPIRKDEQERALAKLGVQSSHIVRLGLPDSGVSAHESHLVKLLAPLVGADALVMAPWSLDFHPDHEACGRAALRVASLAGATLVSYVFWTWHHSAVASFTARSPCRFDLDDQLLAAKSAALAHHRSQLKREAGPPILPESLLGPARRSFESFIIHD